MKNYNELFETLASNNSRLFKENLLSTHKDDKILQKIITYTLNPFIQFYIRKIPSYTPVKTSQISLENAIESLDDLKNRVVTGNAGIQHLKDILSELVDHDAAVIIRIIQKDLKCGVSEATVNKIWPGLIPIYPCMLATQYDEKVIKKITWPAYVQLKSDGMRFNAIIEKDKIELRSRNGKLIEIHDTLNETFSKLSTLIQDDYFNNGVVFDGELLVTNSEGKYLDRKTGNGILNKAVKGTISKKEAENIVAVLWDIIPLVDFKNGISKMKYYMRYGILDDCVHELNDYKISLIPTNTVKNIEEANEIFNEYLKANEEGILLKDMYGIWEDKRAKHQIKFKGELECDLLITGWQEGTGKYAGMLGALECQSSDGKLKVNVGSGFNEKQRKEITPENSIGKIMAVRYNARISDKKKETDSLFLPIFVSIRVDKDYADESSSIK